MKFERLIALALMLAPLAAVADESIDQRWPLNVDGAVRVENIAGSVTVTGWDRNEVHLSGELGDGVEELEVQHSPERLSINVRVRNGRNVDDTDLVLRIPRAARLQVETVSADIGVRDIEGAELNLRSVSGDIEAGANVDRAELVSVSGDVEVRGTIGRLRAESVSGSLLAAGIEREVEVSTVSGDMELQAGNLQQARFESVSGDLEMSLGVADGGRLTVESMSGDVRIAFPANQQGEFRAQSFSGTIRSRFGSVERRDRGPGEHMEHREGSGGATVRLESFSGDITLK